MWKERASATTTGRKLVEALKNESSKTTTGKQKLEPAC